MDTKSCTNPILLLTQTTGHRGSVGSIVALLLGVFCWWREGPTLEGPGVSSSPGLGGGPLVSKHSPGGVAPVAW